MRKTLLKWAGLTIVTAFAASAGSAMIDAEPNEAPVAISVEDGQWRLIDPAPARSRFSRRPVLVYKAMAFPRLTLDLLRLECRFGGQEIQVTGLVPAQRFPQPAVRLLVGDRNWSATPDARYHPRSAPTSRPSLPDSMLDDNLKGRDLSWPGNPPFADLRFFRPADQDMLAALRSGEPVRVEFDSQQRRYPPIPADMAARYAEACAELSPRLPAR